MHFSTHLFCFAIFYIKKSNLHPWLFFIYHPIFKLVHILRQQRYFRLHKQILYLPLHLHKIALSQNIQIAFDAYTKLYTTHVKADNKHFKTLFAGFV